MSLENRIKKLEQIDAPGGFFDGEVVTFVMKEGDSLEEKQREAVKAYEQKRGREVNLEEVQYLIFHVVNPDGKRGTYRE